MHWSSSPENRRGLDIQERDHRWKKIRQEMSKLGVDILVTMPQWMGEDSLYLAGEAGIVIFPLEGEPALLIGGEGSNRFLKQDGWIKDRGSATPRGSTRVAYGEACARKLGEFNVGSKTVAIAGLGPSYLIQVRQPEGYINHVSYENIRNAIPQAKIVDGTPIMAEARHEKSEAELAIMRDAISIAEACGRAVAKHAKPGAEQAEVFGQGLLEQMRQRADDSMMSWCGGGWGEHKWRFTSPPPGLIQPSWYIGTEIGPTVQGYNCQISDPIVVGDIHPQAKDIWELGKDSFVRLCELMKVGSTWGEIKPALQKLETPKYKIELLVHGRGLGNEGPMLIPVDTHEPLRQIPLRPNSTFIVKPYAYPAEGEYAHVTRSHDMTWGDTVVVTPTGAERLGTRPHEYLVGGA
ncbi:MAG: aminopeptidase P family protein [Chloroflexi bacterium]|nr:aminopeptidase P family protein [Chloroflexota bacterium]